MNKAEKPHHLDVRGLKCPLPVLKTRKAMQALATGEFIEVETTDPLAVIDIPAFCNEFGHELLEAHEGSEFMTFRIKKGND